MSFIIQYIKKYKVTYISVVLIFIIGTIIGICVAFKVPLNEKNEIKEYIQSSINLVKENNIDKQNVFKETLLNNLKFLGIVWFLGCTIVASFTIYILMIYKGFIIGYIIMMVIILLGTKQGLAFLFSVLILQNLIILPIAFLLATSGIRMYKSITKKNVNIKMELIRHSILMLISIIFVIVASCIEAYFSTILLNIL